VHEPDAQQANSKQTTMPSSILSGTLVRLVLLAMTPLILLVGLSCVGSYAIAREAPLLLVANPDVSISWLSRDTTRAIFAMRQRTWPDGQAVQVFVLNNSNPVHARFVKERLTVYPHQLQLAWDRMVFSGTGQAPNRVVDQTEMRERVANTSGAIGYLEREYLDDSIQVISMD
jgi:ABC-type phosphate transport system substrate-binding protein